MFAHALRARPLEACGMFSVLEGSDVVDRFHPITNAAESATVFELDAEEMLKVEKDVDKAGRRIVGVMHSHPESAAYPSPTDVRDSSNYDPMGTFSHVVVSLAKDEPVLRCFTIRYSDITEVRVQVVESSGSQDDGSGTLAQAVAMPPPVVES